MHPNDLQFENGVTAQMRKLFSEDDWEGIKQAIAARLPPGPDTVLVTIRVQRRTLVVRARPPFVISVVVIDPDEPRNAILREYRARGDDAAVDALDEVPPGERLSADEVALLLSALTADTTEQLGERLGPFAERGRRALAVWAVTWWMDQRLEPTGGSTMEGRQMDTNQPGNGGRDAVAGRNALRASEDI